MTPDDIEELPAKMVERFRSLCETLGLKDQFVPSIEQAQQFVDQRLFDDVEKWRSLGEFEDAIEDELDAHQDVFES